MSGCQVVNGPNGFIVGNLLKLRGKNVPNSWLASNEEGNYPLVMKQFAMENGPFSSMFHLPLGLSRIKRTEVISHLRARSVSYRF